MMYIGSGYGILEFDPALWRLIAITNQYLAILLNKNANGKMSDGVKGDIGTLESERMGNRSYTSLFNFNRKNDRNFNSARVKNLSFTQLLSILPWLQLWEPAYPPRTKVLHVRYSHAMHSGIYFIVQLQFRPV